MLLGSHLARVCSCVACWPRLCGALSSCLVVMSSVHESPKPRLKVDPDLDMQDHAILLEQWLVMCGTRDLLKTLASLSEATWSQAPKRQHLCEFVGLLRLVHTMTPVLKLNHKLLCAGAQYVHQQKAGAILFGAASVGLDLLAATASFRIRCVLSKFRSFASDEDMFKRMMHEVAVANIQKNISTTITITSIATYPPVYIYYGPPRLHRRRSLHCARLGLFSLGRSRQLG